MTGNRYDKGVLPLPDAYDGWDRHLNEDGSVLWTPGPWAMYADNPVIWTVKEKDPLEKDPPEIETRIGDAHRDEYREHLAQMFAGGYITQDEFYQRSDQVTAARTHFQLALITNDLPPVQKPKLASEPVYPVIAATPLTFGEKVFFAVVALLVFLGLAFPFYLLAGG